MAEALIPLAESLRDQGVQGTIEGHTDGHQEDAEGETTQTQRTQKGGVGVLAQDTRVNYVIRRMKDHGNNWINGQIEYLLKGIEWLYLFMRFFLRGLFIVYAGIYRWENNWNTFLIMWSTEKWLFKHFVLIFGSLVHSDVLVGLSALYLKEFF